MQQVKPQRQHGCRSKERRMTPDADEVSTDADEVWTDADEF
jgi:hypothetical protein